MFDSVAAICFKAKNWHFKLWSKTSQRRATRFGEIHVRVTHSSPHVWTFPRDHLISPQSLKSLTQSWCSFVTRCLFVQGIAETGLCKPVPFCHLGDSPYSFRRSDVGGAWIITIGASNAHLPWINVDLSCSAALHSFALVQLRGFYFIHRRVGR